MEPRVVSGVRALEAPLSASVVTVGTFDGVHLGHQRLVAAAVARARAQQVPAVAYTFHPHPARLFAPARAPRLLTSVEERARALHALGIALVVVEPFDAEFAALSADAWVDERLFARLRPRAVVVGFNFSYGRARGGDPAHLARRGAELGFEVETVAPFMLDGDVVSSTRVRAALAEGAVDRAARLLGRPFALTGRVVGGDRRGRTIGFPTANLAIDGEALPAHGVYATIAVLDDGRRVPAVTNVGVRPTFDGDAPRVETHLFDFDGDLYGRALRVELHAHLRAERRFTELDALVAQIRADAAEARARLEAQGAAAAGVGP